MVFKCLFRGCKKYLLGKVSTERIAEKAIQEAEVVSISIR